MEMGNSGFGLELNHTLKLGWIFPDCIISIILSNFGIQLKDKWQFAKNIQSPSLAPFCSNLRANPLNNITSGYDNIFYLVAMGACPCPKLMELKCLLIPTFSANCISAPVGSTPGESTNMRGVCGMDSSSTALISRTGGSTNWGPSWLMMKFEMEKETRSCLSDRIKSILWNSLQMPSHSPTL